MSTSAVPATITKLRALTPTDLAQAAEVDILSRSDANAPPDPVFDRPRLTRVRDTHHLLARLLAGGMSDGAAAATIGWAPGVVSALRTSPTFQELLAFYRNKSEEIVTDINARLSLMALDAVGLIHERLLDETRSGEREITFGQLTNLLEKVLDRTGNAPVSRHVVATVDLTPDEIGRLRNAAGSNAVQVVSNVRDPRLIANSSPDAPTNPEE